MMSRLHLIGAVALLAAGLPRAAEAAPSVPAVIGCPSLVNLRLLMRQTKDDVAAAAAILANDQADHLGCSILSRDGVIALQEHLSLNGSDYDCLSLRGTSVCHWVKTGSIDLNQPATKPRPGEKGRVPEKARR